MRSMLMKGMESLKSSWWQITGISMLLNYVVNMVKFWSLVRNSNSKILINEVEDEIKSSPGKPGELKKVTTVNQSGKYDLRGTYVHELLIPHIASWISSQFAIKVSKIVNSFIIKEYQDSIKHK